MGATVNLQSEESSKTMEDRAALCRRMPGLGALCVLFPVMTLFLASDVVADGNVTMESITIYNTHEWFGQKPTVYFQCAGEKKVYLPDVVKKNNEYSFSGQESWQPLTTLYGTKCKRCGVYEQDTVKHDDTFYEWELCPKAFSISPDGRYQVIQEKEFNVTFSCADCIPQSTSESEADIANHEEDEDGDKGQGLAFLIVVLVLVVLVGLGVVAYTKWRQKQRAEQQARFVKMFEDDDDLDAELGLKDDL